VTDAVAAVASSTVALDVDIALLVVVTVAVDSVNTVG